MPQGNVSLMGSLWDFFFQLMLYLWESESVSDLAAMARQVGCRAHFWVRCEGGM